MTETTEDLVTELNNTIRRMEGDQGWDGLRLKFIAARDRIEALELALKPFAKEADRYDPDDGDNLQPAWASRFRIEDLRAARNALKGTAP